MGRRRPLWCDSSSSSSRRVWRDVRRLSEFFMWAPVLHACLYMGSLRCIELGRFLHDCRTKQALALEVIAESTRINFSYLQAIEDGEVDWLPASRVFVKAYLKSYSRCLHLEDSRLELRINEGADELPDSPRAPRTIFEQVPSPHLG